MNWYETKSWVGRLRAEDGGWRMPTIDELQSFHLASNPFGVEFWVVWSSEINPTDTVTCYTFNFFSNSTDSAYRGAASGMRALAVRSKNDAEKVETAPAKPPKEPQVAEIARDGSFITYSNGIVKDNKTGLEWVVGPDADMSWYEAKLWIEEMNSSGGNWRLPNLNELRTLYNENKADFHRNMTPLLKTTGWWIWSDELAGSSAAWAFDFKTGRKHYSTFLEFSGKRAFAVRHQER
jgi:hypothetical protein